MPIKLDRPGGLFFAKILYRDDAHPRLSPYTSVWIDHLRSADAKLQSLLQNDQVLTHPCVRLELALGSLAKRETVLADLARLPRLFGIETGRGANPNRLVRKCLCFRVNDQRMSG